ncbi:single-stranded DNA-binding protein [Corynebacterium rhinophilum]|uniref:single-stranded DNA-binding protein n=1 Tax=Corynebacterium rhinophilum TaxID=3050197 RepID=UPI00254BE957|nr:MULTISPECIES: single-stranded DNA-binding protein [unclassified Corynebacterium]MDK8646612.1 single-stranded DNA-binding protein [Corynebacterium sp. MSK082]MDK8699095.1 single-stranded DNA-binding protein [Corynebacterium sp. MSK192]
MIDVITLTGGLPRDAELRFTPQGAAVANFTLANSDNRYDENQNQWVKTRSMYLDVTIWNEAGNKQNPTPWAQMAADLKKGDQVAVTGKLVTRSWETKDGEKRSKTEFQALRFYRMPNPQQGQAQQSQQQQQGGQTTNSGAWSTPPGQSGQQDQAPPF